MKKSKLIALLNALPGNPDIKLWNGMVGDWMEIDPKLIRQDLVKQSLEHWLEMCRLQDCQDRKDWDYQMPAEEVARLTKNYNKVNQWEMNPYVKLDQVKNKQYKMKPILIMQAKPRGVKTWDRLGNIEY
jgi:hypothetical protein